MRLNAVEMERIGRLLPTTSEIAAYFGIDRKTAQRRLDEKSPAGAALREALARGKADKTTGLARAQQRLATGYWRCKKCGRALEDEDLCREHPEQKNRRWSAPNAIMLIWLGKQHLGQTDKSILETKYAGDPKKIPDEDLARLLPEALRALNLPVTQVPEDDERESR